MRILNLITFAILCLFSNSAISQSTAILDSRNGFGELRFDKSIEELKKIASLKKLASSSKTKEEVYGVKNVEDFTVYSFLADYINLWFYDKMLYKIEVKLKNGNDYGHVIGANRAVFSKVIDNYGIFNGMDTTTTTRMVQHKENTFWYGKKVSLIKSNDYNVDIKFNKYSQPIYVGDTWYFVSNDIFNKMSNEIGSNKGF